MTLAPKVVKRAPFERLCFSGQRLINKTAKGSMCTKVRISETENAPFFNISK